MIGGIFHQGSGLGNQLFRYITTRSLAQDKGFEWGMAYRPDGSGKEEGFKGKSFMNIDMGKEVLLHYEGVPLEGQPVYKWWDEKKVIEDGVDIRGYDPEINFVEDGTIIDGEFQDERYWKPHMSDIQQWLAVEPIQVTPDICVIGFRGGEFLVFPDLFLTQDYWDEAMKKMGDKSFEVHTDDVNTAKQFFPTSPILHNVGMNWRSLRYAKYAIIANSSFFILPRLLKHHEDPEAVTIAPRYWARRNIKKWALPQNYYKEFTYL